jgi:glutaconate CoA-transferase subunit A
VPRPIEIRDHSNFSIALALHAAALGAPFIPAHTLLGSDIAANAPDLIVAPSPLDGAPLLLVPALSPDVAIVNVQRADAEGNAHAWGNLGISQEAALAARRVIVVAEEIVAPEVIRSDPNRVLVPGFKVAAVVHAPGGAHPSPVQGYYNRDHAFFHEYHTATRTHAGMQAWLDEWVYGLADRAAYLARLGQQRWQALAPRRSLLAAPVDYGY